MLNFVSFTLTVPAVPRGHRGGDGVAGVEVTPRSTELLSLHPSMLHRADGNFGRQKRLSRLHAGNCVE